MIVTIDIDADDRDWRHSVERQERVSGAAAPGSDFQVGQVINCLDTCWHEVRAGLVALLNDPTMAPVVIMTTREESEAFMQWLQEKKS